ncbi:LysR family transcriptional regulator [Paralimibaculum aggregatum]|uniref:LysR family transcriptional regulator n=1 Tax=Paralimibaculum aggregatum TaxID=3036245 RepID=A0ABQ6LIJ3_9RHOB|nr:LysR family transcriptional regulator [Limibaculum sp. NKW23]GMG83102.1 LysR family transcriptional regulator [Limibaculum sp. NKW23]
MDRLAAMRAFCRIVERRNMARAAEDLGVSPALLSRELKLLEASLGCTLIARTTRTMSLTGHGRIYYEEALRILADVERVEARMRAGAGRVQGMLRVNAPHSFGTEVLSPLLPGFLARHPELELTLSFDDHVIDMVEGGYDLSIRIRPGLPDSGLVARRIAPVRQRLFAAPAYLERRGTPGAPADLAQHAALAYEHSEAAGAWQLSGPGGSETVAIAPRLRLGSSLVLRDMLIAGEGIGTLPDFLSDGAEAEGRLVRVLPGWELPERQVFAVTASRLGADARTLAFIDHLTEALRGHSSA